MNPEPQHNEALRKEIGYRLGVLLSREQGSAPERLLELLRELGEVDDDPIDENTFGPSIEQVDGWLRAVFIRQVQHLRERLQDEPNRYERGELERLLARIDDTLNSDLATRPRT